MIPIFVKSENRSTSELDSHIEYLCEIYQHISIITTSDEIERNRLIGWMLEKILANNDLPSSETSKNKIKEIS